MRFDQQEINNLNKIYRLNLVNSITGFKSANLIGTNDEHGNTNLAIFSSVIHLGSNPPLLGLVMRPLSVPRHTYLNIKATGHFTINHINYNHYQQAHQTSAKYDLQESEFDTCGFTSEYSALIKAPYVKESRIKIGLAFEEEHTIKSNDTLLIVGRILEIFVPSEYLSADGFIDLEAAGTVAISGLDRYHVTRELERLAFARPGQEVKPIEKQ